MVSNKNVKINAVSYFQSEESEDLQVKNTCKGGILCPPSVSVPWAC